MMLGSLFTFGGLAIGGNVVYREIIGDPVPIYFGRGKMKVGGTLIEDPQLQHFTPIIFLVLILIAFGLILVLSFTGYETTGDGITSVSVFRRRSTVRWSEVTDIEREPHYVVLLSPTGRVKIYTGADWSKLKAELHTYLPDKVDLLL